jgi:hypothetical protein
MKRDAVFLTVVACCVTAWGSAPPVDQRDATWVGKRVEAWQPTREERAFDEIGWACDLREAERLARKYERPVFLFTYDGASLSDYRC